MAKSTYGQLQKQIAELEAQAEKIKQEEIAEVVAKIRDAIEVYGLTPDSLFGRRAGAKKAKSGNKARAAGTQYSDGSGNVWGGRGPVSTESRMKICPLGFSGILHFLSRIIQEHTSVC